MVVDCHAHYLAPSMIEAIDRGDFSPHVGHDPAARVFHFPGGSTRPMIPAMAGLDERVRHMDQIGVDLELLSTWVDMLGPDLPEEMAARYHRAVNQGLAQAQERFPERFRVLASVPLPHGEKAREELSYAVKELGAVGALIGTNVGGKPLDDPALDPFWGEAEKLAVPVVLHPVNVITAARLKQYYLVNLLGYPFDSTVAAGHLIFGGVLDRFPSLEIVLLHGGGYLPYAVGRLDHGYEVRPEAKVPLHPPSHYLSRFMYDHVVYDPAILRALVERVGAERILLGSDYPFDMEPKEVLGLAQDALGSGAGARMGLNASRVFTRLAGGTTNA